MLPRYCNVLFAEAQPCDSSREPPRMGPTCPGPPAPSPNPSPCPKPGPGTQRAHVPHRHTDRSMVSEVPREGADAAIVGVQEDRGVGRPLISQGLTSFYRFHQLLPCRSRGRDLGNAAAGRLHQCTGDPAPLRPGPAALTPLRNGSRGHGSTLGSAGHSESP